jgi:alpha-beta hydrolase superfamily lysophospholipase
MHGYTADRRQVKAHAEYYLARGYSVLMVDARAAGRSGGKRITFGYDERKDVASGIKFLREKGSTFVGAHGISLGAAAICYLMPEKPALDFVVLESAYDTIEHAFVNRTRLVHLPDFLGAGARVFSSLMMGQTPDNMRPVESIKSCTAPTLVLGGDSEQYLFVSETQSIFDNCASTNKKMHIFKGARHEIFISRYEAEFKEVLGSFLESAEK